MINPKDLILSHNFKNSWCPDLSDKHYHSDKTALGSSSIRTALRSLKEFYWEFQGEEKKETKDMRLGKIIHMAILEPERFRQCYVIEPIFEGRTQKGELTTNPNCKEVKEKREAWLADLGPTAMVIDENEMEMITGIATSIQEYPDAMMLIEDARTEVSGYYRDPDTGLGMKIRPDMLLIGDVALITDLKSTVDAEEFKFGTQAFGDDKRYDIQLFQYAEGARLISGKDVPQVHIIAVEKTPPYEVAVYYFLREDLAQAEQDYRATLRKIKSAIEFEKWPQRQMTMQRIRTPKWFINNSVEQDSIQEGV